MSEEHERSSASTEQVIRGLSGEINELQAQSIRQLGQLTRHGYKFIDIIVRKDGVERRIAGEWIANLLNPRNSQPSASTKVE